mmetsp:Transcript_8305/g.7356  ORF Transcript_8305/g.7356 Transcript_8305/m.7356 type:complete len:221 (+) Transcript_8305:267-929(+)
MKKEQINIELIEWEETNFWLNFQEEGNKIFIKGLETKIEFLENKVFLLNKELGSFKNRQKIPDIGYKKLQNIIKDSENTDAFFKEQMSEFSKSFCMCKETWEKMMQSIGTNVESIESVRRKIIKTSFKNIIQNIIPEPLGYLCYLMQFEEKATTKEVKYMKKISRQKVIHYSNEKGFTPLDTMYALLELDTNESQFFSRTNGKWASTIKNCKKTINKLFE